MVVAGSARWHPFGRGGWFMAWPVVVALVVLVVATSQVHGALARETADAAEHGRAVEVRRTGEALLADLVDAETGQRGYLLTDRTEFLEPFRRATAAIPGRLEDLRGAVDHREAERLATLELLIADKLDEMASTIAVHSEEGPEAARVLVAQGRGKDLMDAIRVEVDVLVSEADERADQSALVAGRERDRATAVGTVAVGIVGAVLLAMLALLRQRGRWERERSYLLAELEALASRDPLTGLLNRRTLQERLHDALARAGRTRSDVALAFVDLDGFKPVNDALGHRSGDQVLAEVARNLTDAFPDRDTVARVGGDEFVVVLEHFPGDRAVATTVARLREASTAWVSAPDDIPGPVLGLLVTGSVGLASLREVEPGFDGSGVPAAASHLMALADQRMYDDKLRRSTADGTASVAQHLL